MIYTVGNHDANPSYWWTSNTIIQAAVMSQVLGTSYFLTEQSDAMRTQYECRHDLVGDYHILSVTPTGSSPVTYPAEAKQWLDNMLAKLTAADPERFIIHEYTRKVYCIPQIFSKGASAERYRKTFGYPVFFAAGDSEFDLPMLERAAVGFCPEPLYERAPHPDKLCPCAEPFADTVSRKLQEIAETQEGVSID